MSMVDEKVSVIIPVYRVEQYLRRCLDSVINQTYKNLDIILVDDGSPDNSGTICDEYAAKDERIRVIHQKNGGLSAARNAGLDIFTGTYVLFLDSDDWLADNAVERLMLHAAPDTLVIGNLVYWKSEEDCQILMQDRPSEYICKDNFWERVMGRDCTPYIVAWCKLYPRSIFSGLRFAEGLYHEDEAILHHIIDRAENICVTNYPFYYYRQNSDSIMGVGFNPRRLDGFVGWAERLAYFRKNRLMRHEDALAVKYWMRYKDQIIAISPGEDPEGHREKAIRYFIIAFPSLIRAKSIPTSQKISILAMRIHPNVFQGMWRIINFCKKARDKA